MYGNWQRLAEIGEIGIKKWQITLKFGCVTVLFMVITGLFHCLFRSGG